jgi:hypothetical protein
MSADIQQYVRLRDTIFLYSEASKTSAGEYLRLWRIAFRGFVQMGLNAFWDVKTISLPVNDNFTATLPNDYINWVKIGNFNANNELQTFKINRDLTTYHDTAPKRVGDIAPQVPSLSDIVNTDLWLNTYNITGDGSDYFIPPFGLGSSLLQAGECAVDDTNMVIVLPQTFSLNNVILMYVYSPEKDDDYKIPIQFQEAMIAWLAWQNIAYTPARGKGDASMKQLLSRNFVSQLNLAKRMYKPFRLSEANQLYREGIRMVVKG